LGTIEDPIECRGPFFLKTNSTAAVTFGNAAMRVAAGEEQGDMR
jgi:hypothetical protein